MLDYKDRTLRITPVDMGPVYLKMIERGDSPFLAENKVEIIRRALIRAYSDDPNQRSKDGYGVGECKVGKRGYSWYVGKALMTNWDGPGKDRTIDVWQAVVYPEDFEAF